MMKMKSSLQEKESDQVIQDQNDIENFLSTHFYNYEDFENNDIIPELIFDTINGKIQIKYL